MRCLRFTLAPTLLFCASVLGAVAWAAPTERVLQSAAVAVADHYGADTAERIFKEGGNAVDAAVAIAFTLAVTYPEAGNIGGGGFMTLFMNGKAYFLDFRERAPLTATPTMYLDKSGTVIKSMSLVGNRAVAVPGTVDGMWKAQQRFGQLTWQQDLEPAIHYARDGFLVDERLEQRRDDAARGFSGKTNFMHYFGSLKAGTIFRQADLAATLERISKYGPNGFYRGETARRIASQMKPDGLLSLRDLATYRAVWRAPLRALWNHYEIVTAPPPSSGGIGLIQLLKMKALLKPQFEHASLNSALYIHLVAEMEKRVFADRAQYLGDPDFFEIPVEQLIDDNYLTRRAKEVDPARPSDTQSVLPGLEINLPEKPETTHYSLVDRWGNAVSCTYTLNGYFGSGVVAQGTGVLLNDEMDDFAAKPGVPNMFGVVGNRINAIAPGKRPLSSMTPTILTQDGKVRLVIGTPGGSRIFTSIFQVISDLYDFKLPLTTALSQMRFHHQLLPPNTIFWEPYAPMSADLTRELTSMGYKLQRQPFQGDIEVIKIDSDTPEPAADPRGRGVARTIR